MSPWKSTNPKRIQNWKNCRHRLRYQPWIRTRIQNQRNCLPPLIEASASETGSDSEETAATSTTLEGMQTLIPIELITDSEDRSTTESDDEPSGTTSVYQRSTWTPPRIDFTPYLRPGDEAGTGIEYDVHENTAVDTAVSVKHTEVSEANGVADATNLGYANDTMLTLSTDATQDSWAATIANAASNWRECPTPCTHCTAS